MEIIVDESRTGHLGFTLDEIIDALRAHDAGETTEADHLWRLEAVIDRIDTEIADLRRTITNTLAECRAGRCRFQANQQC